MKNRLSKHWPTVLIASATALLLFWLAFDEGPKFSPPYRQSTYERQARSWLLGTWDVSNPGEAIERDGKYYIYFGPLPAVFRLPLLAPRALNVFDARLFLFLASSLNLAAALLVLCASARLMNISVGRWSLAIFSVIAGIGSTVVVIGSRPSMYHEAIAWGSGFILLAIWSFLEYVRVPSVGNVVAVCAYGLSAALSRQTWLVTALALVGGLIWFIRKQPHNGRQFRTAIAGLTVTLLAVSYVNHAKFGWRLIFPIEKHSSFVNDPARLKRIEGSLFHLSNLRTGLVNYLAPDNISLKSGFPYICATSDVYRFPESKVDGVELFVSLPWVMGGCLLLSAAAVRFTLKPSHRVFLLPMVAAWLGAFPLLLFVGFCARYLHDFYPPLILGGAVGFLSLIKSPQPALVAFMAVLVLVNGAANCALAIAHQTGFAGPARKAMLAPAVSTTVHLGTSRLRWAHGQRLAVDFRLEDVKPGSNYPLLTTGQPGRAYFVWLRIGETGKAAYCYNIWGSPEVPCSSERDLKVAARHRLEISFNSGLTRLLVRQDGELLLNTAAVMDVFESAWLGENPIGGGLTSAKAPVRFEVVQPTTK